MNSIHLQFTRDHTQVIKGVAILFMMILHVGAVVQHTMCLCAQWQNIPYLASCIPRSNSVWVSSPL